MFMNDVCSVSRTTGMWFLAVISVTWAAALPIPHPLPHPIPLPRPLPLPLPLPLPFPLPLPLPLPVKNTAIDVSKSTAGEVSEETGDTFSLLSVNLADRSTTIVHMEDQSINSGPHGKPVKDKGLHTQLLDFMLSNGTEHFMLCLFGIGMFFLAVYLMCAMCGMKGYCSLASCTLCCFTGLFTLSQQDFSGYTF